MYTKKVYFLIETKKRELNSQLIVIKELIQKNIDCYIISKKQFLSKLDVINPGVVLLKSIGSRNINFIKNLKKKGHKLVCLDSEGISILHKKQVKDRVCKENLAEIEYFFCWGNYSSNILKNYFPKFSKKLITTGNPKFDLVKNFERNKIYNFEVRNIKKKYGNYLLFLTMFTVFNPLKRYGFLTKKQSLATIGFKNDKTLIKLGTKFYDFQKKNINFFINAIKYISEKFKNKSIIIRPHPTENLDFWEKKFLEFKNVKVVYDSLDTVSWLIASDLNISINCTTSLESYLLNKKSLNLVKYSDRNIEYDWILKTSTKINSFKNLEKAVKKKNKSVNTEKIKINKYLYNLKKKSNSAKIIAKHIDKKCFFSPENKRNKFRYFRSKIYKSLKSVKILKEDTIYAQKIGSINDQDIKNRLNLFEGKKSMKIKEFYPDFVKISK